jgi:hypothetical protein
MQKLVRDLQVGEKFELNKKIYTITAINSYGTSYHSLLITTKENPFDSFAIDKMEKVNTIES